MGVVRTRGVLCSIKDSEVFMSKGYRWPLSALLAYLSVDRAVIFQFSRDYRNAKLLTSIGAEVSVADQGELVWEDSIESSLNEVYQQGGTYTDEDIDLVVKGLGACSYLYSTINIGDVVWGLVGVHTINQLRVWSIADRAAIKSTSLHIGNVILNNILTRDAALHSRIKKSQQLLQKVIDSTPVFLGIKGTTGKFILVNKALSEAAGYASPKDMVGEEDWGDYFPANSVEEEADVLATGEEAITLSVKGSSRCFSSTRKYVEGDSVLPPMVVSTLVDITALNTITKRLEDFTHIASHDLQEPLRTITSFLGLLKKRHGDQISGQAMHYVDTAIGASTRMGALLSDLLSYSRLGSNQKLFTRLSLANVLMKALGNVSSKLIHVSCPTIMYDPNSFPEVWGDEVQLITCLQNLLSNAIKFGDGLPVEVEHSSNGTHWEVRVIDHGIGIPDGMEEAIFKPFKRAHSAYEGTGMGLAIVEKVAHMHQGEAWATSTPGGGTTIHITLRKP